MLGKSMDLDGVVTPWLFASGTKKPRQWLFDSCSYFQENCIDMFNKLYFYKPKSSTQKQLVCLVQPILHHCVSLSQMLWLCRQAPTNRFDDLDSSIEWRLPGFDEECHLLVHVCVLSDCTWKLFSPTVVTRRDTEHQTSRASTNSCFPSQCCRVWSWFRMETVRVDVLVSPRSIERRTI